MEIRNGRLNGDRSLDQLDGRIKPARVKSDDAKQVQDVRAVRLFAEDLPVNFFGIAKPTSSVMCHALLQSLINRDSRHCGKALRLKLKTKL
jgi:hypothetical protein